MKNPLFILTILFLSAVLAACGRRDAADSASPPKPHSARPAIAGDMPGPEDLPPCPGLLAVEAVEGDSRNGSALLRSSLSPGDLQETYAADLSASGWVMGTSFRQDQEHHLQFRQGVRFLRLQVKSASGGGAASQIRMAWGMPEQAPVRPDSQAPDYEEEMSDVEPPSLEW